MSTDANSQDSAGKLPQIPKRRLLANYPNHIYTNVYNTATST